MKFSAFLPCRAGSERVADKNTKPFADQRSLLQIKLEQLERCNDISRVVLSTNDVQVISQASEIASKKLCIDVRDDALCLSTTKLNDLIKYVPTLFESDEIVVWTHVTSPMFDEQSYSNAINAYATNLTTHDSLMTVAELKNFVFDLNGPINFSSAQDGWPRTQDLPTWYEVNSACFIAHVTIYRMFKNRIGASPQMYLTSKVESVDIDTEADFEFAAKVFASTRP